MLRIFASRLGRLLLGVWFIMLVTTWGGLNLVPVASKNPNHGGPTPTSSIAIVLVNSTDGLPHYSQQVTFNVSTTATTQPNVSVDCYQNGVLVYGAVAGFYASYPWPWTQIFTLSSPSWTGGAADCTAALYYFSGKKTITAATLNFQVFA